jgi:hypothetical protein
MSVGTLVRCHVLALSRLVVPLGASVLIAACGAGNNASPVARARDSRPKDVVVVALGDAPASTPWCPDGTAWHGACVARTAPPSVGTTVNAAAGGPNPTVTPEPDVAPSDSTSMAVPGPLAFACNDDLVCGTHRCNLQYGKCAFPCQSTADCQSALQCLAGLCVP